MLRAEGRQAGALQIVAIKHVVGVEGDQASIGMDDMDAGFLRGAHVEGMRVNELHDEHAKNILVA